MSHEKVIIDCDAGIDDVQAIILALSLDVEVIAITCVAGNVGVYQVAQNVLRTLEVCGRTDIPVYKGADRGLLGEAFELPLYHGKDGLGDATHAKEPNLELIQSTHAVHALIDTVNQHPGEITILALAPLTNIALALRMDVTFAKNLKAIGVMGGNKHGIGNHFLASEFNFGADPHAAYVILKELECPISLITWEFCLDYGIEWEFFDQYIGIPSAKSKFLSSISSNIKAFEGEGPWLTADPFVVAAVLCPEIVLSQKSEYATVELLGQASKGMMVVDWRGSLNKRKNANIIEKINLDKFKSLLMKSVQ